MLDKIKINLLQLIDKFIKNSSDSKSKKNLKAIKDDLKNRIITDSPTNLDKTNYDIFLMTSGCKIMTPKNKEEIHKFNEKLSEFQPNEDSQSEKQLHPGPKIGTSSSK